MAAFIALSSCTDDHAPPPPIADAAPTANACPTRLDLELIGSESRFLPGWTGTAHGVGLATGSSFTVDVLACDDECRRCSIRGPVRSDPADDPVVTERCLGNAARTCTADADCDVEGPCRYMFPPIASELIFPTCSLAYFEPVAVAADPSPVQGVIDLYTGELDLALLNIFVAVAVESCQVCQGDPSPYDGQSGGSCFDGGVDTGVACDVHGIGTVVPSQTSFDCPPVGVGAFLPPIPLAGNGTSTASVSWVMDDQVRPSCTAAGATGQPCWCGLCDDGSGIACTQDRDCPSGACAGTMDPMGLTASIDNNSCIDTQPCIWDDATQSGLCMGTTKSCYPDSGSIVARGVAEVHDGFYISQIANLLCMPSFGDTLLNGVGGFPGPFLFEARFRVTPRGAAP